MTIKTTVQTNEGVPVQNAYVSANIQNTGKTFTRYTDGNGYADIALIADDTPDNAQVTFLVQADGYKNDIRYLTLDTVEGNRRHHEHEWHIEGEKSAGDDLEVVVSLVPFA
jgi:hypothetical protein